MNKSAISTARLGKGTIGWEQIDGAVDHIMNVVLNDWFFGPQIADQMTCS